MPFPELVISNSKQAVTALPGRADIAVFVGLVARRGGPVPEDIRAALTEAGWAGSGGFSRKPEAVEALLDVPVAVTSWGAFDGLYAWDQRRVAEGSELRIPCALGLAVRSFFAEGGAKAWIVRVGDPLPLIGAGTPANVVAQKRALVAGNPAIKPKDATVSAPLIPGFGGGVGAPSTGDPATWTGAAHIWGIEDAAMLALPDLPELFAGAPVALENPKGPPPVPEHFKACAARGLPVDVDAASHVPLAAPRLDMAGYDAWARAIRHVLDMLARPGGAAHRRDVMLVASLPLPSQAEGAVPKGSAEWPLAVLNMDIIDVPAKDGKPAVTHKLLEADRLGSARLQLSFPWIETEGSGLLPEGVEGGEGVLMGAIARSALAVGAFRSAAGQRLATVRRTVPELGTAALRRALPGKDADWLGDRLSLIVRQIGGIVLFSDSTMAHSKAWRAGGVSRLAGIVLRAARWLGQDRLFHLSGPQLWGRLRGDFEGFMEQLRTLGALSGASPRDAYEVRCDASTMTQSDIDAGRVIVSISFTAALPIERISVTLLLNDDGLTPFRAAA